MKLAKRIGVALLFLTMTATAIFAVPDSTVSKTLTQSGTVTHNWAAPATGSINAYSGDTNVTGSGTLTDTGNNYYNGAATSWANAHYDGTITDAEIGAWELKIDYPGDLVAQSTYYPTGLIPSLERMRAEAEGTWELRGDFGNRAGAWQSVVDTAGSGTSRYDVVGGGNPPRTYVGRGTEWKIQIFAAPPVTSSAHSFGPPIAGPTFWVKNSLDVHFDVYVRGKQYMHNDEEEDGGLFTSIYCNNPDGTTGTFGTWLKSYYWDGSMWVQIRMHTIG